MTAYGYTWRLITERDGMIVHSGIASDIDGVAGQLALAIRSTPTDLLVSTPLQRGVLLQIYPYT